MDKQSIIKQLDQEYQPKKEFILKNLGHDLGRGVDFNACGQVMFHPFRPNYILF